MCSFVSLNQQIIAHFSHWLLSSHPWNSFLWAPTPPFYGYYLEKTADEEDFSFLFFLSEDFPLIVVFHACVVLYIAWVVLWLKQRTSDGEFQKCSFWWKTIIILSHQTSYVFSYLWTSACVWGVRIFDRDSLKYKQVGWTITTKP